MPIQKEHILLEFIHVKTDGKTIPIDPIRIMKGMFIFYNESDIKLQDFYDFVPYLYGPCSFAIYRDIDKFVSEKFVEEIENSQSKWYYYTTTQLGGKEIAYLPEDLKQKLTDVKKFVLNLSFIDLLKYVYKKYPDYASSSIINLKVD